MEITPWAKVGGLADVLSGLPAAQARAGDRPTVVVPAHGGGTWPREQARPLPGPSPRFTLGGVEFRADLSRLEHPGGFEVVLVGNPALYDRREIYGPDRPAAGYPDAIVRRALLARAALYLALLGGRLPDVVHAHDAASALVIPLLDALRSTPLQHARSVFSIHNLGYLEGFPAESFRYSGLASTDGGMPPTCELHGAFSAIKAAVILADRIQTVSPTYAREVTEDPSIGGPLGALLRARGSDFTGVLNGVDLDEWNPRTDRHIAAPFDSGGMAGREACRRDLWELASFLPARRGEPEPVVVGVVSRLAYQKGLDILAAAIPTLVKEGFRFALVGTGEAGLEDDLLRLGLAHPGLVWTALNPAEGMARRLFAGSDIFCVPSRYEPCGLTQQYALLYGSIPVVRRTGGLADTVSPEVGFLFDGVDPESLAAAVLRAGAAARDPRRRSAMQAAGMSRGRSWDEAARELRSRVYEGREDPRHGAFRRTRRSGPARTAPVQAPVSRRRAAPPSFRRPAP